jgi:hypothetical protein
MIEYYAVIDDLGRKGPFTTMLEASSVLKDASKARGHTDEEAIHFFLHESSVVEVQNLNGQQEFFNLGWLAREQSGREDPLSETDDATGTLAEVSELFDRRDTSSAA